MTTSPNQFQNPFQNQRELLAAARRATSPLPPLSSIRRLLDMVGAPITRAAKPLVASRADRPVAMAIDLPAATGATDAELARLNQHPARGLAAQSHQDGAWVLAAGTVLRR